MLLAAGLGTRLKPLTDVIAKPALPFLNQPLMSFISSYLMEIGCDLLVVNTHHLPNTVHLAATRSFRGPVEFLHEPMILGSGGGLANAAHFFRGGGDFILGNADEVFFFSHSRGLLPLIEFHRQSGALASHLTCFNAGAGQRFGAVWVGDENRVVGYGKSGSFPGARAQHYAGVTVFSERIFSYLPPGESNILYDGCTRALAAGEPILSFHEADLLWFETGNQSDFLSATRACLELLGSVNGAMANQRDRLASILRDYQPTSTFDKGVLADPTSHQEPGSQIVGFAVLGAHCHIGAGARVENSVIGPGVRIPAVARITESLVLV